MKTRQYAQKSIFGLEAIFEQSRNNVSELEQLLSELTFRNTAKARTLTSKIEQSLTALSDRSEVAMSASNLSTCNPDSASIQFSQAVPHSAPAAVEQLQPKDIPDTAMRQQFDKGQIDRGPLPSFLRQIRRMMREQYWQHGQPSKHCRLKVINAQRIWQPTTAPGLLYWSEVFHGDQMPAASPVISFISRSSSAPSLSTRRRTSCGKKPACSCVS